MTVSPIEKRRLHDAAAGLRQGLDALRDADGKAIPEMADVLGCEVEWLNRCVSDMRWMLECLERVQEREAA